MTATAATTPDGTVERDAATGTTPTAAPPARRAPWWPWLLCFGVVAVALGFGASRPRPPATDTERVAAIAKTIACPKCSGESVEMSNAQISREMRLDIAKRLREGQSEAQIQQAYVERYTEAVMLVPAASGITGLVWVLPVVALVCAIGGLAVAFRRWRGSTGGGSPVSEADRRLVSDALGTGDG